jgi:hypothetical protein
MLFTAVHALCGIDHPRRQSCRKIPTTIMDTLETDDILVSDFHNASSIAEAVLRRLQRVLLAQINPERVRLLTSLPFAFLRQLLPESAALFQNIPNASHHFNPQCGSDIILIQKVIFVLIGEISAPPRQWALLRCKTRPSLGNGA